MASSQKMLIIIKSFLGKSMVLMEYKSILFILKKVTTAMIISEHRIKHFRKNVVMFMAIIFKGTVVI